MEIRVLQYFLTIAREESFSKAAEVLHVTQPTLSRQIKELEDEYGKTFFIRSNRSLSLTDDGLLFKKRAEEIMNLVYKTESQLLADDTYLNGDIYLGCGESDNNRILMKAIKKMQERYPDVKFHITSGNAQQIMESLDNGFIDLGVVIEPVNMSKYDFIKLPYKDTWGLWMRNDSELAYKDVISKDDLINIPIIMSNQLMVKNEIAGWIGGNQRKLNVIATYNLIYNALLMVEENIGYVLGLDKLYNMNEHSQLCFKPLSPQLSVGLDLIWKKYQVFPKHIEIFIDILKDIIEKHEE
jgi:DNA-binding transcriptional LysR family regulator